MAEEKKAEFNRATAEIILLAYFTGGGEYPTVSLLNADRFIFLSS